MRYAGWNFEKTLLIRERANIGRTRELIDVPLAVEGERAGNLVNDARVILKRDWNVLDRETPSQVYGVTEHGRTTTFRVAFTIDLAAGASQRVGVYHDNPTANPPDYQSDLEVAGSGLGYRVDTPFYTVETDPASGQITTLTAKIDDQGATSLRKLALPGCAQDGQVVVFAIEDGAACRAVRASAADWRDPRIVAEARGPIFFKQARRGRLIPSGGDGGRPWPELEITYKFFAEQPYFLVHSRLTFPAEATVFGVCHDVLSLAREQFSHYTFRPVSPALPETDVEEMGHILIDPAYTADLPPGLAFSGLLPCDLAWHAFINMHLHRQHAIAGIQLLATNRNVPFVTYRPGTYLVRADNAVQWFRSPIYVHVRDRMDNAIRVPGGTVIEDLNVIHPSGWDPQWGQRVDALGKRLNNPLTVSAHPVYLGEPPPPGPFEPLPVGTRADAYTRAGVR